MGRCRDESRIYRRLVPKRLTKAELLESRAVMSRLVEAVERGELEASTPTARRLLRRLEGALAALDALLGEPEGGTRTE